MKRGQREKRSKIPYFQANNSKTTRWNFLFLIDIYLADKRNIFTNFEKNLSVGFSATLNLWKNKVALNSIDRILWKFAEMFSLRIKQKYIKIKNFHRVVFELLAWKSQNRVSLTSFDVAMATNFNITKVSICSLLKPTQMCTKSYSLALLL